MLKVNYLHHHPFKSNWFVDPDPLMSFTDDDTLEDWKKVVYFLTAADKELLDQYCKEWESWTPPWRRIVAALESVGLKPVRTVSAEEFFGVLESIGDKLYPWPDESLADSPDASEMLAIERFARTVMYRWDKIDLMIKMDLYRPKKGSRLKALLEEWKAVGADDAYAIRDDALIELERGDERNPLFDDCRRRVNEMADNFSKKIHSAREVAQWLEDGSGSRKVWAGDWAETQSVETVKWSMDWLESKFAELEKWLSENPANAEEHDDPMSCKTLVTINEIAKTVGLEPGSLSEHIKAWGTPFRPKRGPKPHLYCLEGIWDVLKSQFEHDPLATAELEKFKKKKARQKTR